MSRFPLRGLVARRIGHGLAATAVAAGLVLACAPAANAAGPILVSKSGGTMTITGTTSGESVFVDGGSTASVSSVTSQVKAGAGCTQLGAVVRCTGITFISASLSSGDDSIQNRTSVASRLSGGAGLDRLSGGSRNDSISGGSGIDFAFGGAGTDTCTAENESSCEA